MRLAEIETIRSDAACLIILLSAALLIGCFGLPDSGALWPDSPLYLNAGIMMGDWLRSGDWFNPLEFAINRYAQYPAFHMPFHPPVYPGLLGVWFSFFGTSYTAARVFIAILFGVMGCFFFAILRLNQTERLGALSCSLLLLSLPEAAHWARDTSSEIPALAFVMAATYCFLLWLRSNNPLLCVAAFAIAELAFLSRVASAGIILIWIFSLLIGKRFSKLFSRPFIGLGLLYLIVNFAWVLFVARFAKYEVGATSAAQNQNFSTQLQNLFDTIIFYSLSLPEMVGWGTLLAAICGVAFAVRRSTWGSSTFLWAPWLVGSAGFLLALRLIPEQRYFIFVLPAFPALVASMFQKVVKRNRQVWLTILIVGIAIAANLYQARNLPRGLIGYEPIANELAKSNSSGNILSVTWQSQDFIFRYQAADPITRRDVIRGDRTLAIRLSTYGGFSGGLSVPPVVLAQTAEDVLEIIRLGRIRYVLTYVPESSDQGDLTDEMKFMHMVAQSLPQYFLLKQQYPLNTDFQGEGHLGQVYLWEYLGEIPSGPSELPVHVPTAEMQLNKNHSR